MSSFARRMLRCLAAPAAVATLPLCASAQVPIDRATGQLVEVNSDVENYLRVLQLRGIVAPHPWSVREFGLREADNLAPSDTSHPWAARVRRADPSSRRFRILAPEIRTIENTTFPYGFNDGPIWAGRGLTAAATGGFTAMIGRLSIVAEPMVFVAQNQGFTLANNGQTGPLRFGNELVPIFIDQPQRFGDGSYKRIDPGQSSVRLDLPYVALGASTADQHWGPAVEHPLILGNNAAGFPHAYLGTNGAVDLWLFKLDARTEAGRLDQTAFSPAGDTAAHRLMTGVVASIVPRGLPNVEFGASRFFHSPWLSSGIGPGTIVHALRGTESASDNQLASLFARAVFPASGVEVYGEFGRDDRNADRRDLTLEPDHVSGYMLGMQKVWASGSRSFTVLRGELLNTRVTHLALARPQAPFYVNVALPQGHTELGQVLGSAAGFGGLGTNLSVDRYDPTGKWTFAWDRINRASSDGNLSDPRGADVYQSLGAQRTMFRPRADIIAGLTLTRELNRNFVKDATNLQLQVGTRVHW
ncbi:MAG TPA: hypothetical protein VN706_13635 [Gemmatimonadaceae bacterium]|nr:hypothetical protein [Gemmatimonadaceae bacterium]